MEQIRSRSRSRILFLPICAVTHFCIISLYSITRTTRSSTGGPFSVVSTARKSRVVHRAVESVGVGVGVVTKVNQSLLQDATLDWDPEISRQWLTPTLDLRRRLASAGPDVTSDRTTRTLPPAMLLLTNYGWNQVNQERALRDFGRRIRETELMQGVINHPWFHPTAWEDYESSPNNNSTNSTLLLNFDDTDTSSTFLQHLIHNTSTRFYVFLDFTTCQELHYPVYAGYDVNMDTTGGRVGEPLGLQLLPWMRRHPVWQSRWLQTAPRHRIKVVVFDCSGYGPDPGYRTSHFNLSWGLATHDLPMALVSISAFITNIDSSIDQGLIPPSLVKTPLTQQQTNAIHSCAAETNRTFLLTYTGNLRSGLNTHFAARGHFHALHNDKDVLIRRYFLPEYNESILANWTYASLLSNSIFSLAARGDNKFSYKFTEILALGAIPVVLSDDWLYPFRPELVNWSECAVILPEKDAGEAALQVLRSISLQQRCRMRQRCHEIYRDYVENPHGTIHGIVQGLELVLADDGQVHRKPMVGVACKLGQGEWQGDGWERNVTYDPDAEHCNLKRR